LGTGKIGKALGQRNVFVPGGNNGETGGAAADGDLSLPLIQEPLDEGQPLAPARIAKPADTLDEGRFQRRAISPALAEPFGMSAFACEAARAARLAAPHAHT